MGEGWLGSMGPKKQKKVSHVWRKVSTQSSGQQGQVSSMSLSFFMDHLSHS